MKKKFKLYFLILLILLICTTGCDKEDYEKYKKSIGNGVSCKYLPLDNSNKFKTLNSITFNANDKIISVDYDTDNGVVKRDYIIFVFDAKNDIIDINFNNEHKVDSYAMYYNNFQYNDFFADYNQNKKCPDIYIHSMGNIGVIYSTKGSGELTYTTSGSSYIPSNSGNNSSNSNNNSNSSNNANGDKLSCDFVAYNPHNVEFGTIGIVIDKNYKITATGKDNLSLHNYVLHSGITSNTFLNANGDLDCSTVNNLSMARISDKKFTICNSDIQCNTGETGWKLILKNSSNNGGSSNYGESGNSSSSSSSTNTNNSNSSNNSNNTSSNSSNSSSINNGGDVGTTSSSGVCNPSAGLGPSLIFVGHIIRIAKILIPLVIIVFGIMDFFRAVTAGKDDEIKKSTKSFVWRLVAGVVIFFLPALISFVFSWIENWNNYEGAYEECFKCIWDVGKCIK